MTTVTGIARYVCILFVELVKVRFRGQRFVLIMSKINRRPIVALLVSFFTKKKSF